MEVSIVDSESAARHLNQLAALLLRSVEDGAVVGFVLPFTRKQSEAYWESIFSAVAQHERLLFCATIDGQIVGTVQLYLSPEPNAPHRAEIFKLLVHRDFQGRGIGTALMLAVEVEAIRLARNLLMLDTVMGGAGERLYRRLGWQEIGIVPLHFVDPSGVPKASVYFMKFLDLRHDDV
ncbi:GNAT family N-acetyltransferase [Rhizobium sp. PL01]|uniref:GNAT family N-acetyltransferase n=1 Tax=Rhizobium sp. PL01 TaxID=3085631 RepID=UPI002982821B|nr:GNAT family N-acetyltransferase [Rhizobium sp. PL01]MDW5316683.1 GNAT family N-acetyltransferase [Rhizobium sp. PL01]